MDMGMGINGEALEDLLKAKKVYMARFDYAVSSAGELSIYVSDRITKKPVYMSFSDGIKYSLPPKAKVLSVEFIHYPIYVGRGGEVSMENGVCVH